LDYANLSKQQNPSTVDILLASNSLPLSPFFSLSTFSKLFNGLDYPEGKP